MIIRARPSIILFGDSITQQGFRGSSASTSLGWVSLLSNAYTRRADLLNRGYSGYNTRHVLDILPAVFGECGQDNVLMVTVFFGANDASLFRNGENCQHVPIDEYEDNLRKIVTTIR
jgi:lysophospholipase L1-like esterase